MKTSIDLYMNMHLWTSDLQPSQYAILEKLKAIGFDGIEFFLGSPERSHYEKLGEFARSLDLKLITVIGADTEVNAISGDPAIRKAAKAWFKEKIDDTAAAGSTNIGGPFHAAFNHFSGKPTTEDEIKYAVEFLAEAGEYAKEKNITLTPEFLNRYEAYFGNTMAQLRSVLDQVNHPNVSAMFDTYHANIEEKSQVEAIEAVAPHLTHVHISENDRGTPGRGQIDFDAVFKKLAAVDFSGTIAIEAFHRQNEDFANFVNVWRNFSPSDEIIQEGYDLVKNGLKKHFV
ncbi:sugar phosphate isomerase/epimerase [Akkermansiaceae bacterium]|nr:sugar phosphate isomerase/epimerase [Akkermansiaceae bacterium]